MRVINLKRPVAVTAFARVAGNKEKQGPLGDLFDETSTDDYFGRDSWEKAETEMFKRSLKYLLDKRGLKREDINVALGGDLCDQITSTAFAYRDITIPFLGLYGACSAMSESMAIGRIMVSGGMTDNALCSASSHFATAERQFRTPMDYGGKRTPTAQWTVTGSAHILLESRGKGPFIQRVCIGKINDLGVKDANNMGAAMAPAAADTLGTFFKETGAKPTDYDRIFTGDLGMVGTTLLKELLAKENITLDNHKDCGLLIFSDNQPNVGAGASGCGCSGCVLATYILPKLVKKEYKKVLFIATGALLSPTTTMQGESIPGIAHLVELTSDKED